MTILLALLSLLVSLAAACAVFWQAQLMTLSMRAATLLDLDARWRSPQMLRTWTLAAERLYRQRRTGETPQKLAESPESDMADVLDFLDRVAYFQKRKVLDVPLVWNPVLLVDGELLDRLHDVRSGGSPARRHQ